MHKPTKKSAQTSKDSIPDYLRPYVVDQQWERYTSRQHATWRFIMRQAREFFRDHAHTMYLQGLEKTGIPISEIPRIEVMDAKLREIGWGAVCVSGFIPPLTFLDFQSRQLLPIAADMRSLEHLTYTPAPDIVHEAAGHAPILADPGFAQYLTNYAELARKAIFSLEDVKLYEAIRCLSDAKENPDSQPEEIAAAAQGVEDASRGISWVSEAAQVARMNWWTAEYGLIGDLEHPQIFGAGLLSSLQEGKSCLEKAVTKIPLSLACIEQSYDITQPQPQLYVANSFSQLSELLDELGRGMAFNRGGISALALAKKAQTVTTVVVDSGLEISGVLVSVEGDLEAGGCFLRWQGPVQLCWQGNELPGQGSERHRHGFSGPLGPWQAYPQRNPADLHEHELSAINLCIGQVGELSLSSGVVISGRVKHMLRRAGKLLLITWDQCRVQRGSEVLFIPEWGEFDQPVGISIPSVFGGPADRQAYGDFYIGTPSSSPGRRTPYSEAEKSLFALYQRVRELRNADAPLANAPFTSALNAIATTLIEVYPEEWLLAVELCELLAQRPEAQGKTYPWLEQLKGRLLESRRYSSEIQHNINLGLKFAAVRD